VGCEDEDWIELTEQGAVAGVYASLSAVQERTFTVELAT
jgi:hypothetical protein